MRRVGIMQGRLSPPRARLQSFPHGTWEEEFECAAEIGFDTIEWVFEAEGMEANPIWSREGREQIRRRIESTGVQVETLCANYFVTHPFFRVPESERADNVRRLKTLIDQAADIGTKTLLIPVLEASEIRSDEDKTALLESLRGPLAEARSQGIKLSLESELPAPELCDLIDRSGETNLGIYYDCGNATARGYDAAEEVSLLRARIAGIHIKDRPRGGGNVPLGTGDLNFGAFFEALDSFSDCGLLVLETTPGNDAVAFAKRHLAIVRGHLRDCRAPSMSTPYENSRFLDRHRRL